MLTKGILTSISIIVILLTSGCADQKNEVGKIAFISERYGSGEIYIINTDGSNLTRLTDNKYDEIYPVLSPDGKKIAFISYREIQGLFLMNMDGSEEVKLADNLTDYGDLEWSPDGDRIAFVSKSSKRNYDIYIADADGSNRHALISSPAYDFMISCSK